MHSQLARDKSPSPQVDEGSVGSSDQGNVESDIEIWYLSESENSDDIPLPADTATQDVDKTIREMLDAASQLPDFIRRGSIPGISGSYSGTKINGQPSEMTIWRQKRKVEAENKERKDAEEAFQVNPNKRRLLTHFFKPCLAAVSGPEVELEGEQSTGPVEEHAVDQFEDVDFASSEDSEPDALPARQSIPRRQPATWCAPTIKQASEAVDKLMAQIRESRRVGYGYKYANIDMVTANWWKEMLSLLRLYTSDHAPSRGQWIRASTCAAIANGKSPSHGRKIRRWCQLFILDSVTLPRNVYGAWNTSVLHSDEDLQQELIAHLQGQGQYFSAKTLVRFLNSPAILERMRRERQFSERTARRWLQLLGYRWKAEAKGMYSDGHERDDVVQYRQSVFLPLMAEKLSRSASFDQEGQEVSGSVPSGVTEIIVHMHDESIFYAHDRRNMRWCHTSESPKPYAKGEGQSFMVADFVSDKLGWLKSLDGKDSARVCLKPGKEREGYFSSNEVLGQLTKAMDILNHDYPQYEHVFVLDNARTHTKRAEDALSARQLPKNPNEKFGVLSIVIAADGKPVYDQHGKVVKKIKKMGDGRFADGAAQPLYYPLDHPQYPGWFKGMTQLLRERGFTNPEQLRAECPRFRCVLGSSDCCQRRILFTQPDFMNVPSLAETFCAERGFKVIFLPKFHPELNFIEMCWGYSKRVYRETPPSSKMEDLQKNAIESLEKVPIHSMRRLVRKSVNCHEILSNK